MTTNDIGKKYVELVKAGKYEPCLKELFSNDAESIEAAAPPGKDPVSKGMDAIVAKGKWWAENHTVHSQEISGPYPNGDRFAVRFVYDITNKPSGQRMNMDEVGLFTVKDGKIVKEEFFYAMG